MSPTEFMRAYETVANPHDLEALLELVADDAIYLFSNQTSHIGKLAVRKAIQANFESIKDETYAIQDLIWSASSDEVAACVYEFVWSGKMNGKAA